MVKIHLLIRAFIFICLCIVVLASCTSPQPPNIILILADDMGWSDLGCYGSTFHETPNIDNLAAKGIRFTDAYASCAVCSPTRAGILTGKHPARLKITDWIPGVVWPKAKLSTPPIRYELPLEEVTLAEALKKKGYQTFHVGKWHLGQDSSFYPQYQGFDINIAGHSKGAPGSYFYPYAKVTPETDWTVQNLPPGGEPGEYLTDRLTKEATKLITQAAASKRPFFMYMSYYAVHTPLEGKPAYVEKYKQKKEKMGLSRESPVYAAMMQSVDESVGKIMATLESMGLSKKTLVLFTADNGGLVEYNGNAPLREGKGFYYEGGIREPFIVYYPGKIPSGRVIQEPTSSIDIFPTLLEAGGSKPTREIDGSSLWPMIMGIDSSRPVQPIFWHYPHYHTAQRPPTGAVRLGDFKLIEFFETGKVELYNLKNDLSELHDLAAEMPDKTLEMKQLLQQWRKNIEADMPWPNPNYDPADPFAQRKTAWSNENKILPSSGK